MAEMMDDIAHLSQEIGPRPAGTEEEQQAALYIADELQKSAGFSTIVEDVSCASNGSSVGLICFALGFLCTLLAVIFPVLSIPCIIIGLLAAGLFACEAFGKPVLSRFLRNGVSQNVVAKYNQISITNTNKRRKIILVTHYDSARVAFEYQGIIGRYLPIIRLVCTITLAVAPLILLIKTVFFASEAGGFALVLTVLQIICLVIMALPLISIIKTRFSSYNEAANNDAAGVAVLLDVARTVGNGLVSTEEMEERAREAGVEVHGEEAAREAGVLPDGAEVTYQVREQKMSPEESLAAAKAAIAALTGKPVADKVPLSDISSRLVRHGEFSDSEEAAAAAAVHFEVEEEGETPLYTPSSSSARPMTPRQSVEASAAEQRSAKQEQGSEEPESFVRDSVEALQPGATGMRSSYQKQVPAWAKAAQEKAHANKPDLAGSANVSRSRFADAPAAQMADASRRRTGAAPTTDAAVEQASTAAAEAVVPEPTYQEPESELAKRIAALREEIDDAAAPLLKKTEASFEEAQQDEPVEPVAEPTVVEAAGEGEEEELLAEGTPVIVQAFEPDRQSASDMIEEQQSKKHSAKRKTASRHAIQKNGIGGFLGRASNMVSNVSSKVAGRRGNHAHDGRDQDEAFEDDIVLVEDLVDDLDGRTTAMPQIDVEQFNETSYEPMVAEAVADHPDHNVQPVEELYVAEQEEIEPVSPILGMDQMAPLDPTVPQGAVVVEEEERSDRHVIVLPDVVAPVANTMESAKQRAPMAADPDSTQPQAALLSNMIPQIGGEQDGYQPVVHGGEDRTVIKPIGLDLPDFNTSDFERVVVPPINPAGETMAISYEEDHLVSPIGAAGSTGSFAAVGAELIEEEPLESDFIEDADDSVFDEGFTQTGAFAGPDYVEMPRSRVGRIFGRFGKKKNHEEQTISEWVDVDSSYEAREVGKERGSWESFRNDDQNDDFVDIDYEAVQEEGHPDRDWNGGAFSLQSLRNRVSGSPRDEAEEVDGLAEAGAAPKRSAMKRSVPKEVKITDEINNEMRLLRDFRHPDIDTEVWFVALGAEEALNSGMKAFIEEHRDELKGATIVNLEGLGAGKFTFIDEEGQYRPNKVSSRLKRVLRQASEKSGVSFATGKLLSRSTAAHVAAQHGLQAMTLAGMDGNQTAYYGSIDDTLDIIESDTLEQNSRFVLELLKSV